MGNCYSVSSASTVEQLGTRHAPPALGVSNRVVYPPQNAGDVQVVVCSAKWAANADERTPAVVKLTTQHAFVALFDGLGDRGDSIAAFCRSCVYEVFLECCLLSPGDLSAALKATFAKLDERLLSSPRVPAQVKAASGASGVIAYVDLASQQCLVANVGHTHCLLGRIVGSFNAKLPEGFFLSADHTLSNKGERVRVHKRTLSDPEGAGAAAAGPTTQLVDGVELVQGVTQLTRALGFASCKQQRSPKRGGAISCTAEVNEHRLTPTDQHLIIGSAGLWDVVGPQDAALRSHFYEKMVMTEAAKAAAAAAAAGQEGSPPLSPSTRQPNTAEHLVLYGASKVADRLTRETCQAEPLSVADLMQIPFERPPPREPAAAGEAAQPDGSDTAPEEDEQEEPAPFIRRELHGDLAAVVVALRWQSLSMDDQMRAVLASAAAQRAAAAAAAGGGAGKGGQGGEEEYMRRRAQALWGQVRMLAEFHRVYRRTLLRRWWDAADQVYRHGKIRARGLQDRVLSEQVQQVANLRASAGSPLPSWKGKEATPNRLRESVGSRTPLSAAKQHSLRGSIDAGRPR